MRASHRTAASRSSATATRQRRCRATTCAARRPPTQMSRRSPTMARRFLPLDPRQCRRRPRLRDVCVQRMLVGPWPRDHRAEVSAPRRQPPRQDLPRPRRQGQSRLHRAEAHRHARHPRRDRLPRQRRGHPAAARLPRRLRPGHREWRRSVPPSTYHARGGVDLRRG